MTFDAIVAMIAERTSQRSTDAITRIGEEVNRVHKRIVRSVGLDPTISTTLVGVTVADSPLITFGPITASPEIIGIIKIQDIFHPSTLRPMDEITQGEMDARTSRSWPPNAWCIESIGAYAQIVRLDATADDDDVELTARVKKTSAVLIDDDEPVIPENWHDLLIDGVLAIEYQTKLKDMVAYKIAANDYDLGLKELQQHLAESRRKAVYQGKTGRTFLRHSVSV